MIAKGNYGSKVGSPSKNLFFTINIYGRAQKTLFFPYTSRNGRFQRITDALGGHKQAKCFIE
jgi:hypothetical protein